MYFEDMFGGYLEDTWGYLGRHLERVWKYFRMFLMVIYPIIIQGATRIPPTQEDRSGFASCELFLAKSLLVSGKLGY